MANTIDDKIKNGLFIWGNNTVNQGTDLASLTIENGFVTGVKGGDLIEAKVLNSGLRGGSLVAYSIIEALKLGPQGAQPGDPSWGTTPLNLDPANWWQTLSQEEYKFDYDLVNVNLPNFCKNLRNVANEYLKYASVYRANKANALNSSVTIKVWDSSSSHSGQATTTDFSSDVDLNLPDYLDASITGSSTNVTTSINGKSISSIFETNGTTVKTATNASKLSRLTNTTATTSLKILFGEAGAGFKDVYTGDLIWNPANKELDCANISTTTTRTQNVVTNYFTCSTAASTAAKTADIQYSTFVLEHGSRVLVKMSNGCTVANATLNINGTGAKKILINGSATVTTTTTVNKNWGAGETLEFIYDNTGDSGNGAFVLIGKPKHAAYSDTAAQLPNSLSITLNGSTTSFNGTTARSYTLYAPSSAGSTGQVLKSNGSGSVPAWVSQSTLKAGSLCDGNGVNLNVGSYNTPVYFSLGKPVEATSYNSGTGFTSMFVYYKNSPGDYSDSSSGWTEKQFNYWYYRLKIGSISTVGIDLQIPSGSGIFTTEDDTIRIPLSELRTATGLSSVTSVIAVVTSVCNTSSGYGKMFTVAQSGNYLYICFTDSRYAYTPILDINICLFAK